MEILIITQARIKSKRLPSKVLLRVKGISLLEIHISRIKQSKYDNIVVATTFEKRSNEIINIAKKLNVKWYQGSTDNVLERFYNVAKIYNPNYVVRLTSDCPLIDPKLINETVDHAIENKLDYCSNNISESYPDGQDVEVISYKALKEAFKNSNDPIEKEHVTPYIKKNSTMSDGLQFKSGEIKSKLNYGHIRITVDEFLDYNTIKILIENLGTDKSWLDYSRFIEKNNSLFKNQKILRNEGYLNDLKYK